MRGWHNGEVAVEKGNIDAVGILLEWGASPDHYNSTLHLTPIHVAARRGNNKILSLLLADTKAGLDLSNQAGETALHLAVDYKQLHYGMSLLSISISCLISEYIIMCFNLFVV